MFVYRRVSKDCRVTWPFALILALILALFLIGCLPKAPPPLVSSINSAAVQMGSGPSVVLSQRAALSPSAESVYGLTQANKTFSDRFVGEASVGFGKGLHSDSQRRRPGTNEAPHSGERVLGVMSWLAAGRAGGVYELASPFYIQGGLGYGLGDSSLHYLTADAMIVLAGHGTKNLWGSYGVGFYYTQVLSAGSPLYISDWDYNANHRAHERESTPGILGSLGLGYWFSDDMGFSGAFDLAVNMPPSGNSEEVWPQFALSIGLHYRFDPT